MQNLPMTYGERQPYTGSIVDKDPISSRLARIGQLGPYAEEELTMSHGRYLSGLGEALATSPNAGDTSYSDSEAQNALEKEDDVYGSGIFDVPGRASTTHSSMGVFADHPSVPGYLAREVDFSVSKDVHDVANGADMVFVPGGGMAYVEREGRIVDYSGRPNPFAAYTRLNRPNGIPGSEPLALQAAKSAPVASAAAALAPVMASQSIVTPNVASKALSGFGATESPTGADWKTYLAGGLLVGVAAAMFFGTLSIKPGSGKKSKKRARR